MSDITDRADSIIADVKQQTWHMEEPTVIDWTKPIIARGSRPARWLGTLRGVPECHVVAYEYDGAEFVLQVDAYGLYNMSGRQYWMVRNKP